MALTEFLISVGYASATIGVSPSTFERTAKRLGIHPRFVMDGIQFYADIAVPTVMKELRENGGVEFKFVPSEGGVDIYARETPAK